FTGDGVMAFWNAPTEQADHAVRAVRAALRIQARIPALLARWRSEKRSFSQTVGELATGIGINTGEAVVGNIGSARRVEYTAIGDTVNLAARLQGLARGGEVLVTEPTLTRLGGLAGTDPLPPAALKGKTAPVPIFRVRDLAESNGGSTS
ncbi:MAG TPA: adenylate/guanylate cyclase domain-containing protein, partial [bacterium]|nr:adenylate/guanylate cyclase domain-containing protein [bacterium]